MQRLEWLFATAGRRLDLVFGIFLLGVLALIVLPVPRWLVDVLVTFNWVVAIALVLFVTHLEPAQTPSIVPPAILIVTLVRVVIMLAVARLVLADGDPGAIVTAVGALLIDGHIRGGLIIVLALAVGLVLVVRRFAARVADVNGRFVFDMLPRLQLQIDRDLRAGAIERTEALHRHAQLDGKSHMLGAMTGAMLIVKGDALASLVVMSVELFGGLLVGTMFQGMDVPSALQKYALLAAGGGMATLGPTLLCALAGRMFVGDLPATMSLDKTSALAA